jgi:hypothetical protein
MALRSSVLGWALFRTAIRYHFPPDVAPPAPGREPAPRARLTPERPGAERQPIKLLRLPDGRILLRLGGGGITPFG